MKAMLVDDEPFILQGLSVLIDWETEGYEIVKKASDGREALDYLRENNVDLIITDIRMPRLSGLELLETIRNENISDAYVIVLSGYNDFKYVRAALRHSCMDYILKPVQKEQLITNIRRAAADKEINVQKEDDNRRLQRGYLLQNMMALLQGKAQGQGLSYIKKNLRYSETLRYLHICLNDLSALEEMSDEEMAELKNGIYEQAAHYLQNDADHLFKDFFVFEEDYEIGFVYCDYMAKERGLGEEEFLEAFHRAAQSVDELFAEMDRMDRTPDMVTMNLSWLIFRLLNLASEQDESVSQDEVLSYISGSVSKEAIIRGSRAHLRKFACEFAEYRLKII